MYIGSYALLCEYKSFLSLIDVKQIFFLRKKLVCDMPAKFINSTAFMICIQGNAC